MKQKNNKPKPPPVTEHERYAQVSKHARLVLSTGAYNYPSSEVTITPKVIQMFVDNKCMPDGSIREKSRERFCKDLDKHRQRLREGSHSAERQFARSGGTDWRYVDQKRKIEADLAAMPSNEEITSEIESLIRKEADEGRITLPEE